MVSVYLFTNGCELDSCPAEFPGWSIHYFYYNFANKLQGKSKIVQEAKETSYAV